tara:strand:+ start:1723 stop:2706 length:984 start_codon:yes stop_codon:yes gene_type:complete
MIFVFYNILVSVISLFIIESLKNKQNFIVVLDYPNDIRKIHTKPIPLLGGIILFLNLLFFFTYKLFDKIDLKIFLVLYLLNFSFFLIGFIDDKKSISPIKKTLLIFSILFVILPLEQNLIVKNLIFKDIEINILLNEGGIFFTIFCIYFFFNFLNFSDGLNGISLGISLYWTLVLLFLNIIYFDFIISLIFCIIILLIYNLRNQLFLGNSGSSLLSVIFSSLFILQYNQQNIILCDEIFLLVFLQSIDSGRVSLERILKGVSPFKADNIHFHHLLLKKFNNINSLIIYLILSIIPFALSFFGLKTYYAFLISLIIYISSTLILKKYK